MLWLGYAVGITLLPLIVAECIQVKAYGNIFGTPLILESVSGALGLCFSGLIYTSEGGKTDYWVIRKDCV